MNRKGFFKTLFGGFVAASAAPSLVKAEETPQPPKDLAFGRKVLRIDEHGNVGLGTNTPTTTLHVEGIVFHVNDRMLEMSGNEKGDFEIKWLNTKENETNSPIVMQQPKDDPWKKNLILTNYPLTK